MNGFKVPHSTQLSPGITALRSNCSTVLPCLGLDQAILRRMTEDSDVNEITAASGAGLPRSLRDFIERETGCPAASLGIHALNGDAGFRRYYRLQTDPPLLAVDAPPATENSAQFVALARWFESVGVPAPSVLAVDLDAGHLLVEDVGQQDLQSVLNRDSVHGLYGQALSTLLHLQTADSADLDLPTYDAAFLRRELHLFREWFIERWLGVALGPEDVATLDRLDAQLIDSALSQPTVLVHRDFHCRNLIVDGLGQLSVIDFQDAVFGPLFYDAVSLLKDCYQRWPDDLVQRWALAYATMARDAGLAVPQANAVVLQQFHRMGLQRHLKVLGIFTRLSLRDSKSHYLGDLPRVYAYIQDALAEDDELKYAREWFSERLDLIVQRAFAERVL